MKNLRLDQSLLEKHISKMIDNKNIFGAVMCVESGDKSFSWTGAAGNMQHDSKFFIASVTKLFVTAVVMQLIDEHKLKLEDKISLHLPDHLCKNIHVLNGIDFSDDITIKHLISNTSGLPDYFFHKQINGSTVADELMAGKDEAWEVERSIELVKQLKPKFKPGAKGKASYSDTNYQLLGRIIETVTGLNMSDVFQSYIFSKLNLTNTYTYQKTQDNTPAPFYYKSKELWLPNYMSSIAVEGGIVSTAAELMIFLKAFFSGYFFEKEKINDLKKWNWILPPPSLFFFGIGLEKLWTPWIISPFKPIKEILGFWGQTGSFAFYNPDTDVYFSGTTNQINGVGHRKAGAVMLKTIKSVQ